MRNVPGAHTQFSRFAAFVTSLRVRPPTRLLSISHMFACYVGGLFTGHTNIQVMFAGDTSRMGYGRFNG